MPQVWLQVLRMGITIPSQSVMPKMWCCTWNLRGRQTCLARVLTFYRR